jgi:hypothetical protein
VANTIAVREFDLRVLNMRARMPFRYGIATLEALPHLFVRVVLEVNGASQAGTAADGLPPKWFTKNPDTSFADDLRDMRNVIENACGLAMAVGRVACPFDLWRQVYDRQMKWAQSRKYPPLLASFGVSLVERAAIDAFCKATATPFSAALHENTLGIRLNEIHPELASTRPSKFLPRQALLSVIARHTVGLSDPLTEADITAADRVNDGLPQSLEACIRAYGLTHFKIKLCGDAGRDLPRLRQLAKIIGEQTRGEFAFTLDGNEQFHSVDRFQSLWQSIVDDSSLQPFLEKLMFVEQPFHRDVALAEPLVSALRGWDERPWMIIDESDGTLGALPRALTSGYNGSSHKNCKGIFKGIANACLIAHRNEIDASGEYILSGEDLANVGPVALLQDLAAAANFGIPHVERNGHHYFRGLSMFPKETQEAVLSCHGDLYRRHELGFATLRIEEGRIDLGSVVDAPFGCGVEMKTDELTPLAEWNFESLCPKPD